MPLKNVLIVVGDLDASTEFYTRLLDMRVMRKFDGKTMLTGGLLLHDKNFWDTYIGKKSVPFNNATLLYFEVEDIGMFAEKLKAYGAAITYLNTPTDKTDDKKVLRFYDLDGNLIEVREMAFSKDIT